MAAKVGLPVNCGVYLFSTRIYLEFGLPRYPEPPSPLHHMSGSASELAKLSHTPFQGHGLP